MTHRKSSRKLSTIRQLSTSRLTIPAVLPGQQLLVLSGFVLRLMRSNSVFESTIRYVGGMLSAYELTDKKYPVLVKQAATLADKLSAAWSLVRPLFTRHIDTEADSYYVGQHCSLRGSERQHQHTADCYVEHC